MKKIFQYVLYLLFRPYLLIAIPLIIDLSWYYSHNYSKEFIEWDGKGYYSYLPAALIYDDLNFKFQPHIDSVYYKGNEYDYRREVNGKLIDKYYIGTAIIQLPFFLIAHALTYWHHEEPDGYSYYYGVMISIAAIFYCLLALFFLDRLLKKFYHCSYAVRLISLTCLVFGTNIHYYTINEPSLTHIYSFFLSAAFIYLILEFISTKKNTTLVASAIIFSLITLIRPVNAIILLSVPFLAGSYPQFILLIKELLQKRLQLIICAVVFILIISIQLLVYKIQCGNWFVYSYVGESMDLLHPHFIDFLVSYKKGIFIYTPYVLVMILSSVYFLFRKNLYTFFTYFIFFLFVVYVISSWWNWWYGGSFSARPMIEFMPIIFLPFAIVLSKFTINWKRILLGCMLLFPIIIFNQLKIWQYRHGIIHWEEMDKERYYKTMFEIPPLWF